MATHSDSVHPILDHVRSIRSGDKVKVIYGGKLRTFTVVSNYDRTLTLRLSDLVIRRSFDQVIATKPR
jgi:hypothetical protein